MILEDLKAHIATLVTVPIKYNIDSDGTASCVVVWDYGGTAKDLGTNANVQITAKALKMSDAKNMIQLIYDSLYPKDTFQKGVKINNKLMHVLPKQEPFWNDINENNLHSYIFNVSITAERS